MVCEVTALKNRVAVNIAGQEYTFLVEEEHQVLEVAKLVDEEIRTVSEAGRMTEVQCAVLCAMNMAERAIEAEKSAEHLRGQLKASLDDTQKAQREAAEAKRELSRMKK